MRALLAALFLVLCAATVHAQVMYSGQSIPSRPPYPSNSVGVDNAWYLDLLTGNVYGPKTLGQWPTSPTTTILTIDAAGVNSDITALTGLSGASVLTGSINGVADGSGTIHEGWAEAGGIGGKPEYAPVYYDLTNTALNRDRGIECTAITTNSTTQINKGCIALYEYTPPDNGGDGSGLYIANNGGANAISAFALLENIPYMIAQGYVVGNLLTINNQAGPAPIYPGMLVSSPAFLINSGSYNGATGAVSLQTSNPHGLTVGSTFTVISISTTNYVQSLLYGTFTATAGTSGTTLNYTAPTSAGTATVTTGWVGVPVSSGLTVTSQLTSAASDGSKGTIGTYQLSASVGTIGSSSASVYFSFQFPQYPNNGYNIEDTVDGTGKVAAGFTAANGIGVVSRVLGNGKAFQALSTVNTPNSALAFEDYNASGGDVATIDFGGNGDFISLTAPNINGIGLTGLGQSAQPNGIQLASGDRMQILSYWGLELHGDTRTASPTALATGSNTDAAVSIWGSYSNLYDILDIDNASGTRLAYFDNVGDLTTSGSLTSTNFTINGSGTLPQQNGIQVGSGDREQILSYWGLEVRGHLQGVSSPALVTGTTSDASLNVFGGYNSTDILDLTTYAGTKVASFSSAGAPNFAAVPTSAGGGGLYFCVDSAGNGYKKSSCP